MKVILRRVTCRTCGARNLEFNGISCCLICRHAMIDQVASVFLSAKEAQVLQALLYAGHRPLPMVELIELIYPDSEEEPDYGEGNIVAFQLRLNKKLPVVKIKRDGQRRFNLTRCA